jgi:hypothetical protein
MNSALIAGTRPNKELRCSVALLRVVQDEV